MKCTEVQSLWLYHQSPSLSNNLKVLAKYLISQLNGNCSCAEIFFAGLCQYCVDLLAILVETLCHCKYGNPVASIWSDLFLTLTLIMRMTILVVMMKIIIIIIIAILITNSRMMSEMKFHLLGDLWLSQELIVKP